MMASATSKNSISPSSVAPRHMSEDHGSSTAAAAQSRRPSRQVSSPWTQIVRGESEPIAAASSSPQSKAPIEPIASVSVAPSAPLLKVEAAAGNEKSEESGCQGNAGKKPVWRRPSNGAYEVAPIMGASSWPTLSETTKAPLNKSDSFKNHGDLPSSTVPVSQGIANASVPSPKQGGRANPNPTPNYLRQRSYKRNGSFGSTNGTVSQPSAQGSFAEMHSHNPSTRGQNQKNGFVSQNYGGTDNLSQRGSYRNQNDNHHHSHGGRRNQDHGEQNWTFQRRDGNTQSQRRTPPFVRHAPPHVQPIPPQFMAARPIQPFGSHLPFSPKLASPYYPHMPFIAAPAPVFYHVQDPLLNVKLQKQIHYYFSEENLVADIYLRGFMDDQGFAPLRVIAGFKKVAELTDSIEQIMEALQGSPFVEVQGDRIRKRQNWQKWILPKMMIDAVASRVGNLSIDQSFADPIGGSNRQLQPNESENKGFSGVNPVSSNHNNSDGSNHLELLVSVGY